MPHEDAKTLMDAWESMRRAKRVTHAAHQQFRSILEEMQGRGVLSYGMKQMRPEEGAYVVTDWVRNPVLGSLYGELIFLDEQLARECAWLYSKDHGTRVQVLRVIGLY